MKWTIEYLEDGKIVFVKPAGALTYEESKKLCEEVHALAQKHGAHRYLVDNRGKDIKLSVLEIEKIPDMIKKIGAGPEDRIAVLYHQSSPKILMLEFLGNVLFLRSFRFKIFSDEDKAKMWLKSEE